MSLSSSSESDGRTLRALRAMRKIVGLGLRRDEVIELYQRVIAPTARTADGTRPEEKDEETRRITADRDERLQMAQDAIRTLVTLGFAECEIADLGGLSASTISRVLDPDEARVLAAHTVARLYQVLERAGAERLKALLPKLNLRVLETCCDKGWSLNDVPLNVLEQGVRNALMRTLVGAEPVERVAPGVTAVLVQVGDDEEGVWIFMTPFGGATTLQARLARARAREHEAKHLFLLARQQREELEMLAGNSGRGKPPNDSYLG